MTKIIHTTVFFDYDFNFMILVLVISVKTSICTNIQSIVLLQFIADDFKCNKIIGQILLA